MTELAILIVILSLIVAGLPSYFPIKKENSSYPTTMGYALFFLWLMLIVATGVQIYLNQQNETNKETNDKANQKMTELRIRQGIDSGIRINNMALALAFKEQNINIDSLKNELTNKIDSVDKTTTTYSSNRLLPDFDFEVAPNTIRLISIIRNKYSFKISLKCKNAQLRNLKSEMYAIIKKSSGKYEALDTLYFDIAKMGINDAFDYPIDIEATEPILEVYLKLKSSFMETENERKLISVSYRRYSTTDSLTTIPYGWRVHLVDSILKKGY